MSGDGTSIPPSASIASFEAVAKSIGDAAGVPPWDSSTRSGWFLCSSTFFGEGTNAYAH